MTEHYFTDTATATLEYVADGQTGETDTAVTPATVETVTLDTAWTEFFGTDQFVQFDATVAQPIEQPYVYDGQLQTFRKDEDELREAQAQLNHLSWTMGHPDGNVVSDASEIRGFWTDPVYDDGQHATLNVPANDEQAVQFALEHDDVSVGFSGTLDWETADEHVDAVQRNMAYDHVASVDSGRCPPEKGCGLHRDGGVQNDAHPAHGHVHAADAVEVPDLSEGEMVRWRYNPEMFGQIVHNPEGEPYVMVDLYERMDGEMQSTGLTHTAGVMDVVPMDSTSMATDAVRTTETQEPSDPQFSMGDWVEWDWGNGTATGRVTAVSTESPITVSGTTRDPTEEGEPVYRIEHWDDDSFGSDKVAYESNLRSASKPSNFTDDCSLMCTVGSCSCGRHNPFSDVAVNGEDINLLPPEAVQEAAQQALNARDDDDVTVNGMESHGWSRAEQLASGAELSPSDIVGSSGAMAPWWSRHATYAIEGGDTLSLSGTNAENPWEDNSYTAAKGWGGVTGYKWAIRKGNEIKRARGDEPTYDLVDSGPTILADETIQDTITYDGLRRGDLDESEIPNEGYEPHYVFDDDIKSDSSYPLVDGDGYLRRGNVKAAWELYGQAEDEQFLLDVLAQANEQFANTVGHSAPIPADALADARNNDTMTDNLTEFIDEQNLDAEDVIDALDVDVPGEPTAFYDGEPDVETLADDFDTVELLVDEKESLEGEIDSLEADLHEYEKEAFADTAGDLAALTDKWGDEDELLERFNDEDDDEFTAVDDLEDKIELVEDIKGDGTTTVTDEDDTTSETNFVADNSGAVGDDTDLDTTQGGSYDLRSVRGN